MTKKKFEVKLPIGESRFNTMAEYKRNGIGTTKLFNYLIDTAEINKEEMFSRLSIPKNMTQLKLSFPKRAEDDKDNVIKISKDGHIVVASTKKVLDTLVEKGYLPSEITNISRYKEGIKFARDFWEYGLTLNRNSTIEINGIVREGDTSVLRNREFSEPLRLVLSNLWHLHGIETVLFTNTERYRLNSILDYTRMEWNAIRKTYEGRMAQATNNPKGLTEVLRNYLITNSYTPIQAVELTVAVLKTNGKWLKEKEELASYVKHFVSKILIKEYGYDWIAGYNMVELEELLLSTFENIELKTDKLEICDIDDCYNPVSQKKQTCPTCTKEGIALLKKLRNKL